MVRFGGNTDDAAALGNAGRSKVANCAISLTVALSVVAMPITAAAEVPWAKPAANKPSASPVDREWAGVKFTIDKDEWRDTPRRHRFVHGCFSPSHLCMSLYLPPEELYRGRFVNHMEGGSAGYDKLMTQPGWEWAFNNAFDDLGAYLVETNEGHWPDEGSGLDDPRELWKANAHGVRVARTIAEEMYGRAPARGYITGCSGGGMRSELGFVSAPDLFDGAVPQSGHGGATMMGWNAYSRVGMMLGKDGVTKLVDAADVGGTGKIFEGLTPLQADAVSDFLRLGWPRDAMSSLREYWGGSPPVMLVKGYEDYYRDFWTKPGYEGHDNPELLQPYIIDQEVTVRRVMSVRDMRSGGANAAGIGGGRNPDIATYGAAVDGGDILDTKPAAVIDFPGASKLFLSRATVLSGPDAGKVVYFSGARDDGTVMAYLPRSPWGFDNIKAGDKLRLDNRDYLAFAFQYRHIGENLTKRDFPNIQFLPELEPLLTTWGQPKYVQVSRGPETSSRKNVGHLAPHQKEIYLSGTADEAMWPAYINTHVRKLHGILGPNADDQFRIWWMEGVPHCSGPLTGPGSTNRVNNQGFVAQALIDVMNWAEHGTPPPPSTAYQFEQNSLVLPNTGVDRKGIQPVVSLTVDGGARAEVRAGTPVQFTATADVPPGTGSLQRAEWDFDGQGVWPRQEASVSGSRGTFTATYTYDKPGVYFPAIRIAAKRDGISPGAAPVYNLARARVIVR